jgi:hypothetical protein
VPPTLEVQVVPLGIGDTGLWCPTCALPTAVRLHYAIETRCPTHGPIGVTLQEFGLCLDCGRKVPAR